jgi:hypothetical protein
VTRGHLADELRSNLQREARLARPSRSGEREQARAIREHRVEVRELLLSAEERVRGER